MEISSNFVAFSEYMNLPKAELVEVLRCSAFTSVMRSKIPAKIMVYKTPTNEIHKTIQVGTKMISQGQLIILEKNNYVLNAMVPRVLSPNPKKREVLLSF